MKYLFLSLAVLGSAVAIPISEPPARTTNPDDYVLPGESFPTFYDVQLYLDPDNVSNFTGSVSIRILAARSTNTLVLQAMAMEIHSVSVRRDQSQNNILSSYTLATDDTHILTLGLSETLDVTSPPHIIEIEYTGSYANNMFGIYRSTYAIDNGRQSYISSQLQPTSARRVFPCYDEPSFKAIFRTTIYAPSAYRVVKSNMPLRNETLKSEVPGYVKHEFEDTLTMSTYLQAYLVSDFEYIDNEVDPIYNIPFKVYSRPGTQDFAKYALEFGQKNMIALEEYTEFPYAFPKVDKAAVPAFPAGAMENWGLVIYREGTLLYQEGVTTTSTLQSITTIISHENTHMWFGNEVSPQSWTYTWLNEGFAAFFQNFASDLVYPEYRLMDQFLITLQNVMQSDAVLGVNPMTHPVYTPSQAIGTFNNIAYQKSGSVIRMIQHVLTPEIFRRGLVIYLRKMSRRAAVPTDLYSALQEALDQSTQTIPWSVSTVFQRWATQSGFPVITVRRTSPSSDSVYVTQERYLTNPDLSSNELWHIPINWVLSTNVDFRDTSPQAWVSPTSSAQAVDITGLSQAEWFIVNKQETGYYRVNYDPENWEAIASALDSSHESIHVLNRAQLVDDSFNLARNERLDYKHAFQVSKYLSHEKDYIPWASFNNAYDYINIRIGGSEVYDLFQNYLGNITAPVFDDIGVEKDINEEHVTAFHRNIIVRLSCQNGNQRCIVEAERVLKNLIDNPTEALNPDIRTTLFCAGLRGGNIDIFNFFWERYQESTDASEQSTLLNSLGCTSHEDQIDFLLEQVIDDDSPLRQQHVLTVVQSIINGSPQNMEKALDFAIEHFPDIQRRTPGARGTANMLDAFSRRLNSAEHIEKINEFESRYSSMFVPAEVSSVGAIKENIQTMLTWSDKNMASVSAWLIENYGTIDENGGNSANAVSSSVIILVSAILLNL